MKNIIPETKTCRDTKTRSGCYTEKVITDFGIASTNRDTGKVYRKNICKKCEWSTKGTRPPPSDEAKLYNQLNSMWR